MKKLSDLTPYVNVLPYASEIFGVYQPLLGWRARRPRERAERGLAADLSARLHALRAKLKPEFAVAIDEQRVLLGVERLEPARLPKDGPAKGASFVFESIQKELPARGKLDGAVWDKLLAPEHLRAALARAAARATEWYREAPTIDPRRAGSDANTRNTLLADQLARESRVAGYLSLLHAQKQLGELERVFFESASDTRRLLQQLSFKDPLDTIDPHKDLERVSLSPIGVVHLFRQYFFELDTFLGSPVEHVWLSPGSEVELVEISTRRELVERMFEQSFESIVKNEKSTTEEDEISEAIKQDNRSDLKFGASATVNQSWVTGQASAATNIDLTMTEQRSRETTHRHMRTQSEKLSTELRRSYKSTFRQVTERTDTSSKRYLLKNATPSLINYELRRKMRQVGVQVQDIGTYLCWQTYVDDPGHQLGIAELVHIAKEPELGAVPPPEAIPLPQPIETVKAIDIPFVQTSEDRGDLDEGYVNGCEIDEDLNEGDVEMIQATFAGIEVMCEQSGFQFGALVFDYQGCDAKVSVRNLDTSKPSKVTFDLHLDYANFRGNSPMRIAVKVTWNPLDSIVAEIEQKNHASVTSHSERTRREYEKAFVDAARERVKLASNIEPRRYEDLREEERIVVYRRLIQEMLTRDIAQPDDRTRHVVAELLDTIFDVDKMLYFVAPEWWRPRLHQSHQSLGGIREPAPKASPSAATVYQQVTSQAAKNVIASAVASVAKPQIADVDSVSWGGAHEQRADNYFITEESSPAKLGSSLGWLLQLDGDNLRNAFLNAPWVKAVLPIRPGKERAALNWLQRVEVEGSDGLDDHYVAPAEQLARIPHSGSAVTVRDAVLHLCDEVAKKHTEALEVGRYPEEEIHDDNRVSATPIDRVYEHGFYPLQDGFRLVPGAKPFEVFDQWIEVLPTDQVVPVEVKYDPKSGRQI